MKNPFFTIITISYNKADEIERTIKSIVGQTCKDYEYILVDGKSTDTTMNIVEKYQNHFTKIVSEKDHGIYDAMNKGLGLASGRYIVYINAGDEFYNERTLETVKALQNEEGCIYGSAKIVYGKKFLINKTTLDKNNLAKGKMLCHQSLYVKRDLLNELKGFNQSYKIAGDFDLCCRLILTNPRILHIDSCLSTFYKGGASANFEVNRKEIFNIIRKYFSLFDSINFYIKNNIIDNTRRKVLQVLGLDKIARRIYLRMKGGEDEDTK